MSAKPETPSKEGGASLTQRDFDLLLGAFECNKNDFVVDYAKFAEKCGLANANSAKASWHGVKKKLDKIGGGTKAVASPTPAGDETPKATPAKGKKRNATEVSEDAVDGEEAKAAPASKKKRGRKAASPSSKSASPAKDGGGDGGDTEGGETIVRASPVKAEPDD